VTSESGSCTAAGSGSSSPRKLATGLSGNTVRLIHATLRALLNAAGDDGVILANPAQGLGRTLRLGRSAAARQEEIKVFDRDQLARFLGATAKNCPRLYPL
jgi:integrase